MTCLDLRKRSDVMLGITVAHHIEHIGWMNTGPTGDRHRPLKDVLFCKTRLLPRPFRKCLQIWSILGILAFLVAAFTSDVPFSEKQTVGHHKHTV
jgi:hypothetical protein